LSLPKLTHHFRVSQNLFSCQKFLGKHCFTVVYPKKSRVLVTHSTLLEKRSRAEYLLKLLMDTKYRSTDNIRIYIGSRFRNLNDLH